MTDENKPKVTFTEEKVTDNPDKYKSITGVREGNVTMQDNDALRDEMRAKVGATADFGDNLAKIFSDSQHKAVRYGIFGAGQGGSRLAEQFYQFGYKVCVANTSQQDLHYVNLPKENKLLVGSTFGGAGKDVEIGEAAFRESEAEVKELLGRIFGEGAKDVDSFILCTGLGGGTGTSSIIPMIEVLSEFGLPITVLCTLPTSSEGTVTKSNAIAALDKLGKLSASKIIAGLIVIDNSRIEDIYSNVSLGGFYKVANFDIASIFNTFNTLSSLPSNYVSLDPTDFLRIMTSGNCTVFGKVSVPLSIEDGQVNLNEDDLAQTLLQSVTEGLLAKGFDVKETVRGGVYILGKASVLNQIPAETFSYAFASLNDELNKADIFRGVYNDERLNDQLQVYILLSGLGLPRERVNQLMEQAQQDLEVMESKEVDSKARMEVFQKTSLSEDDKYRQKKKQNSTFGKMMSRPRTRG